MWDDRYDTDEFAYGKEANDFLKAECARIPAGGRVLCLAEGEGRNAVYLAEQGFEVTAMDLSEVGLAKAQRLATDKGVTITTQVADLADYTFGEAQWDGIVSIWAHVPKTIRQKVHAQVAHVLKSKGVFILEAYTAAQIKMDAVGGPPADQKDRFVALADLRYELLALNENIGDEKHRMISEGTRHQGLSAVVQFVGTAI